MVKLWAVIYTLAVTGAVVVQGASLTARESCDRTGDPGHLKCETSGGSPLVTDCESAIDDLTDNDACYQGNGSGSSHCTTLKHWHSCKIDVCGRTGARLNRLAGSSASRCKVYLRNLLHSCKSGNVVGGQVFPQTCNVNYWHYSQPDDPDYNDSNHYRVQFSRG